MYIPRILEEKIRKYMNAPEIISIVGPRQSGKTTLLRHIQESLEAAGFITFEDVDIRLLFENDIHAFIDLYVRPWRYLIIDEFQYAREGGQKLKLIYDTMPGKKIFISGSSLIDLTISSVKQLVGRVFTFTLYPLTFKEFLNYREPDLVHLHEKIQQEPLSEPLQKRYFAIFEEFIRFGGYPRVVTAKDEEEKKEVLKNLVNLYLLRDVRDIIGLADDYALIQLLRTLALQIGNVVVYQELQNTTGQSAAAVRKYLNLLEKTYVLSLTMPFYSNKRLELVKNPKVYFLDTGLRNAVIGNFQSLSSRPDKGASYENHVFCELIKADRRVKFWRTKSRAEVDFIVDDGIPVEVKSLLHRPVIGKSLYSFIAKYRPEKAYILNENLFTDETADGTKILFRYLYSATDSE
jgi:predicted AAA+ superfamily ATPase